MLRFTSSRFFLASSPLLLAESNRRRKHLARVHYGDETNPLSRPTVIDKSTLYIVPTPIGNIKDFSLRSLEVIRQVDYLFCINKVATQVLMDIIDINCSGRLLQYNKHARSQARLAELVKSGSSAALLAPQGMPIVGDQGVDVVQQFLKEGVRVSCLPGPAACVTALAMSGASGSEDAFFFGGHLSLQRATRLRQIKEIEKSRCPSVFYESSARLRASLEEISIICGPTRQVSVVHEISKVHEATHRDAVTNLVHFYSQQENRSATLKGQATIIVDADPLREKRGHMLMSSAARNENQHNTKRNKPALGESAIPQLEDVDGGGATTSNSDPGDVQSLKNTSARLEAIKRGEENLGSDEEKENGDKNDEKEIVLIDLVRRELSRLESEKLNEAFRNVASQMNISLEQVSKVFRSSCGDGNDSGEVKSLSDEERKESDERDDEYDAEFKTLASDKDTSLNKKFELMRHLHNNNNKNSSSSKFSNLVKPQNEIRQVVVDGDQHFPSDWIPEKEEQEGENEKIEKMEVKKENVPVASTKESSSIISSSSSSSAEAKARRKLEARRKLMRALSVQTMKTKLARRQLNDERRRE